MAPAAEFLFATPMVDEAAALDAFEWMAGVAEADGKRLVIKQLGPAAMGRPRRHGLSNLFIDALSDEGVVFVSSNGNNGDSDYIDHTFSGPGDTIRLRAVLSAVRQPQRLGPKPDDVGRGRPSFGPDSFSPKASATWWAPARSTTRQTALSCSTPSKSPTATPSCMTWLWRRRTCPTAGPFLQMRVRKGSSNLAVVLRATAQNGRVHAWNHTHLSNDVGNWGQDFQAAQPSWLGGDPYYGIQQPACGQTVIAVGAYSSEYPNSQGTEVGGTLANFSTYGPTLDERLKPNVSAPGVSVSRPSVVPRQQLFRDKHRGI